uniref:Uncharacterized protein n=1 Tax=Megaviridae environmental sample TaxID=1737588 RepID=A0A5J6VIX2_9VIRU|nr:MAG: hypothetical protein [Megaviridae environmental sample]
MLIETILHGIIIVLNFYSTAKTQYASRCICVAVMLASGCRIASYYLLFDKTTIMIHLPRTIWLACFYILCIIWRHAFDVEASNIIKTIICNLFILFTCVSSGCFLGEFGVIMIGMTFIWYTSGLLWIGWSVLNYIQRYKSMIEHASVDLDNHPTLTRFKFMRQFILISSFIGIIVIIVCVVHLVIGHKYPMIIAYTYMVLEFIVAMLLLWNTYHTIKTFNLK